VPDELTPEGGGPGAEKALSIRNYGLNMWGDLFNSRQKHAANSLPYNFKRVIKPFQKFFSGLLVVFVLYHNLLNQI